MLTVIIPLKHVKIQKKEQKRAKVELKEKNNEERRSLVTQVLEVQSLLESLGDDVKDDFLSGQNGAVVSLCMVFSMRL